MKEIKIIDLFGDTYTFPLKPFEDGYVIHLPPFQFATASKWGNLSVEGRVWGGFMSFRRKDGLTDTRQQAVSGVEEGIGWIENQLRIIVEVLLWRHPREFVPWVREELVASLEKYKNEK